MAYEKTHGSIPILERKQSYHYASDDSLASIKHFNSSNLRKFGSKERQMIENGSLKGLQDETERLLSLSQSAQQSHLAYRGALRKLGNKTAAFAEDFSMYLREYSGLLEILKQGDDMLYGGAAYQALSMLLIVRKRVKVS